MTLSHRSRLDRWATAEGSPSPLGATWVPEEQAYNFALFSRHATGVTLMLYSTEQPATPVFEKRLDPLTNKTGRVWHCRVPAASLEGATLYAYKVDGAFSPSIGERFDSDKVLLDPYAKRVFFPPEYSRGACCAPGPTDGKAPLGYLPERGPVVLPAATRPARHTHDAIVYELHVKGFTARANSGVTESKRGTFAGLIEKIPYLQELGVTVVELLPVHQFDPQEDNYWGYMTLSFFSPHEEYAADDDPITEFRGMVAAFHAAGIEVWLDVVFNHTSEGNELGPTYSFKGIDNSSYYLLNRDNFSWYLNDSGAGNTMRCNHPAARQLVVDSLRYWATQMQVDGFRFDLASVFALADDGSGNLADPPVVSEIGALAAALNLSLVAEAWDVNTYQLGRGFPGITWSQWNDRFRDDVRRFVKGDAGLPGLMRRLYGSDDVFTDSPGDSYRPFQSINFVNAHDGLNLYDTVAYTSDRHHSWDCGWQGEKDVPADVIDLRRRQVKNFCALLMLANGVPMFVAGDEFMNTQQGNDNPYNQDNETTWLDWDRLQTHGEVFRFFKSMIGFRKAHPSIGRSSFWREDVTWYGVHGAPDFSPDSRAVAYHLRGASEGDDDLYVMVNSFWQPLRFTIEATGPTPWRRVADTGRPGPDDFLEPGNEAEVDGEYEVGPRSIVVLRSAREL